MALRTVLNLVWTLYQEYFAVYKVGAAEKGIPLLSQNRECAGNSEVIFPVPAFTVISYGFLAGNKLAVQYKIPSANFWEVMFTRAVAYHTWTTSSKRYEKTSVGDSDRLNNVPQSCPWPNAWNLLLAKCDEGCKLGNEEIILYCLGGTM